MTPAATVDHGPFQLVAACRGACPVGLSGLAGERALAVWADRDGNWAQRFDLARGTSLGAPLALGELTESDLPYVFALPDGDAAIFGTLPDGRVTFVRGSEVAARRVAPKVVVPRAARGVSSLAASASGNGLVLLLLRKADEKDLRADNPQIDVELYWLDATGKPLRAPLVWKTRNAVEARAAACGERLYLAWGSVPGVLVTRLSASGQGREQALFPRLQSDYSASAGPLLCTGTGASMLAGWQRSGEFEYEAKLSIASVSAAEALSESGRWQTLNLPGVPQLLTLNEFPFGAYPTSSGVKVLLEKGEKRFFVGLDPAAGKLSALPDAPKLAAEPCIPTSDGRGALCIASKTSHPAPKCKQYQSRLTASFVGSAWSRPSAASASLPSAAPVAEPYVDARAAAIVDPWARSGDAEKQRRSLLRCGEPGWDGLRKAIQSYCDDLHQQPKADNQGKKSKSDAELNAYCGKEPSSLLFQATNCSDEPLVCGHPRVSSILSVERAEFEHGSEGLIMKVGHCELAFAGKGDTWRVDHRECGD